MSEYVGCKVKRNDEKTMIMFQDDLIQKIEKTFGELVKNMQVYVMPAGTGARVIRNKEGLITKKGANSLSIWSRNAAFFGEIFTTGFSKYC